MSKEAKLFYLLLNISIVEILAWQEVYNKMKYDLLDWEVEVIEAMLALAED